MVGFKYLTVFVMAVAPPLSLVKAKTKLPILLAQPPVTYEFRCHSRRSILCTTIEYVSACAPATLPLILSPPVACASYGDSSNIVMPNYIEYLIEKNEQGMPVESLYKGPDAETQIRRIGEAANRLPEIITLANEKKWSQVQGLITGPLGTLLQTMNSHWNPRSTLFSRWPFRGPHI